jgi:hypothetical protein
MLKTIKSKIKNKLGYKFLEEPGKRHGFNKKKLSALKNLHEGERCFIVGNGPSLNKIDLRKLANEYTFGANSIYYKTKEMGFYPTYFVIEDTHVMRDNIIELNAYEGPKIKFFPSLYKRYVNNRDRVLFFNMNRGFYEQRSPNYHIPRFTGDIGKRIYCGQSVTIICLQIAFYMGFKKVYLVGMDFDYKIPSTFIVSGENIESTGDDPNHFHPDYFGKGKKWHDPKLDNVLLNYRFSKLVYEANNRQIVNATKGGKLEAFERVDFDSLF